MISSYQSDESSPMHLSAVATAKVPSKTAGQTVVDADASILDNVILE